MERGSPAMKRTWTIIGVSDVPSSFRWYQSLFGHPETEPHQNPSTQTMEFSLRDPDGYYVSISSLT